MDGNGRWAKKRAMNRIWGHEEGTKSVRVIVRTNRELGIPWLTLYAFSEENWKRSKTEIKALMGILKRFLKSELKEMQDNDIRFMTIGRVDKLPDDVQKVVHKTIEETSENNGMVLTLALSYGSRQEILHAVQNIAAGIKAGRMASKDITEQTITDALFTSGAPDPDLLIRTSGEYRISNFLLWQIAYTEIYITPVLWPDFRKKEFLRAIEEYQNRERRFGGIIET
jgi:undecaprenyl diphosphate synthase